MEDGLRDALKKGILYFSEGVLILVLVEDGLRDISDYDNKYCIIVLILVLVEDGLRVVKLQLADLQTFRCEKRSKFQKSHEKKYIFHMQNYVFLL